MGWGVVPVQVYRYKFELRGDGGYGGNLSEMVTVVALVVGKSLLQCYGRAITSIAYVNVVL